MTSDRRAAGLLAGAAALLLAGGAWTVAGGAATTLTGPPEPLRSPAGVSAGAPGDVSPAPPGPSAVRREGFAPSLAQSGGGEGGGDEVSPVPVRVSVPRIGVDSALLPLGIADDGSLQVPDLGESERAGWLTTSAVPGRPGPSVIAGHVDSRSGPAVFFRLHELVPGDEVLVQLDDGSTVAYAVDGVVSVDKDAFPTQEVYGPRPAPVLRLLTCGGAFDRVTGHYEQNVIAFASPR